MTMFGIGPYSGLKFSCFNTIKGIFNQDGKLNNFQNFLIGSFSGCFAVTLTYPTDLIRKNLHVYFLFRSKS